MTVSPPQELVDDLIEGLCTNDMHDMALDLLDGSGMEVQYMTFEHALRSQVDGQSLHKEHPRALFTQGQQIKRILTERLRARMTSDQMPRSVQMTRFIREGVVQNGDAPEGMRAVHSILRWTEVAQGKLCSVD